MTANKNLPVPCAITREEGGRWLEWPKNRGGSVHAIMFTDGTIFDAYNGWRPSEPWESRRRFMDLMRRGEVW